MTASGERYRYMRTPPESDFPSSMARRLECPAMIPAALMCRWMTSWYLTTRRYPKQVTATRQQRVPPTPQHTPNAPIHPNRHPKPPQPTPTAISHTTLQVWIGRGVSHFRCVAGVVVSFLWAPMVCVCRLVAWVSGWFADRLCVVCVLFGLLITCLCGVDDR